MSLRSAITFRPLLRRTPLSLGAALLGGVLAALLLGGCGGGDERDGPLHGASEGAFQSPIFPDTADTRTQALQALDSLRRGAMQNAFERLADLGYTRRVRTEQLNRKGRVIAYEERTMRHAPGGGLRVLRSDSSGSFDFGTLGRFADTQAGAAAADLAQQVIPDEPAFLSERNRYAFQYRLLPDTTLASGPAQVIAVRARPSPDGDKQTVRHARLHIDRDTRQLVSLRLHRARRSLLFDETTRQFVRLRPAPADPAAWVPAQTRFETRLDMPLRPARRFRSKASYDQYRLASSS